MLGLFFIHFCLPEISVNTVLQQMNRKTDPTSIQCWDSNSRALDGHFPPVGNHSLLVEWLLDMRGANLWTKFRSRVTTNRCDWMFQLSSHVISINQLKWYNKNCLWHQQPGYILYINCSKKLDILSFLFIKLSRFYSNIFIIINFTLRKERIS